MLPAPTLLSYATYRANAPAPSSSPGADTRIVWVSIGWERHASRRRQLIIQEEWVGVGEGGAGARRRRESSGVATLLLHSPPLPTMVPVTAPDDAKPAAAAALARPDSAGKRKDAPAATGSRFRAAATMVVAMRRFQCERGERGGGR